MFVNGLKICLNSIFVVGNRVTVPQNAQLTSFLGSQSVGRISCLVPDTIKKF